jgi:hypothetical protein
VDRSVEQAFFAERTSVLSDHPISFDLQPESPVLDLERREERRARYKRVVSGIVATLCFGVLLAFTRPNANAAEAEPVAAVVAPVAEPAQIQPVEPAPPSPEVAPVTSSVALEVVPPVSAAASASVSAPPSRGHSRVGQAAPAAAVTAPVVPVVHDDRPPPTARFAD